MKKRFTRLYLTFCHPMLLPCSKLELARGIVVRLRNLTPDVQSRLAEFFRSEGRGYSLTCARGVCSILSGAGIGNLGILPTLSGNSLLKRLIYQQLTNPDKTPISSDLFFYM